MGKQIIIFMIQVVIMSFKTQIYFSGVKKS